MLDCIAVGKKIHEYRLKHNMKQDELADKIYVTRQAISRWEMGNAMPSLDNLVELTKLFSCSLEQILCLDENVEIDDNDIFKDHDRLFIIKKILDGSLKVDLSKVINQLTADERLLIIHSLKNKPLAIEKNLYVQLTDEEKRIIGE